MTLTDVDVERQNGTAKIDPPRNDHLHIIFVILGMLTLAAWNFYLTAVGFFELWFPGRQWAFIASMTYQAMNVLGTSTMVRVGKYVPFKLGYLGALGFQMVLIVLLPSLAFWSADHVDGDSIVPSTWGFACALGCCGMLGLAEAVFTSLICGLAGSMGDGRCMAGIMTGQGIVGVLCPVLMLSLKFLSGDPMKWKYAVVFGFFGSCAALQAIGLYLVRYIPAARIDHRNLLETVPDANASVSASTAVTPSELAQTLTSNERRLGAILKDVLPQLMNIFLTFVVTFVVFPGVAASWAPQLDFFKSKGHLGQDWYTTSIIGMFQVFDVVGRSTSGIFAKMSITARRLWIPVLLRCTFVPSFMLLQRFPDVLPAPSQDYVAFTIMALFAVSNGWCSTNAMIHGPQQVEHPAEQHRAGIVLELGLILGILVGSVLAMLTQLGL